MSTRGPSGQPLPSEKNATSAGCFWLCREDRLQVPLGVHFVILDAANYVYIGGADCNRWAYVLMHAIAGKLRASVGGERRYTLEHLAILQQQVWEPVQRP